MCYGARSERARRVYPRLEACRGAKRTSMSESSRLDKHGSGRFDNCGRINRLGKYTRGRTSRFSEYGRGRFDDCGRINGFDKYRMRRRNSRSNGGRRINESGSLGIDRRVWDGWNGRWYNRWR